MHQRGPVHNCDHSGRTWAGPAMLVLSKGVEKRACWQPAVSHAWRGIACHIDLECQEQAAVTGCGEVLLGRGAVVAARITRCGDSKCHLDLCVM
jgi:hypothetical protein